MDTTYVSAVYHWLLRSVQLQLFLSLISFPILLAWGIPISLAAPAGNILLGPFLTIFLFFSSLVFFTECMHVPNFYLVYALEKSTDVFVFCMKCGSAHWLIGFAKPPLVILGAIPVVAILVIQLRKIKKMYQSVLFLLALHLCISAYLKLTVAVPPISQIAAPTGSVTLISHDGLLTLIDPGCLGRRISAPTWTRYQLTSSIIQMTGKTEIAQVLVLKCNKIAFDSLVQLCTEMRVGTVYLPPWEGCLAATDQNAFDHFLYQLSALGTRVVFLHDSEVVVHADQRLYVHSTAGKLKWHSVSLANFSVSGTIVGQRFRCEPLGLETRNK